MIGQTISHYHIIEKLGEGGMGVVYAAEDTHLGRQVAIKLLPPTAEGHHYRARFSREARTVSALSHPNIATVYDGGETEDGRPFIVMELVRGKTLSDLLNESALTLSKAVAIIEAVADALSAAHERGIIHRDIKPSNIMVNERGQVKVLDFGLAKLLHDEHLSAADPEARTLLATQTQSGVVVGTPLYLSPEQATGQAVDARSDLFALGAVLYESVTGRPAFSGGSVLEIGAQVIHVDPVRPSAVNGRVPKELERVVMKALAKKVEERYQSAEEMLLDLQKVRLMLGDENGHRTIRLNGSHRPVNPPSAFLTISETLRRPRLSIGFLLIILMVAGFSIWGIIRLLRPAPHKPSDIAIMWYKKGTDSLREGAYYRASTALEQAVKADDQYALAHARLAEAWMELGYGDRAKDELLRVSTLVPDRSVLPKLDALYLEAINAGATRDFSHAIEAYQKIAQLTPNEAQVYVDLGRAYEKNEDIDKAIESYVEATNRSPQYAAAYLRLGILYGRNRDASSALVAFDKAESLYQSMSSIEGRTEVLFRRGKVLRDIGRVPEARSLMQQALDTARANGNESQQINILLQLAGLAYSEGEPAQAQKYAQEAVDFAQQKGLESLAASGLTEMAWAHLGSGSYDESEKTFREALDIAQRSKVAYLEAKILYGLGSALIQKLNTDEGLEYVKRALAYFRENNYYLDVSLCLTTLGRGNRRKGDYDTALQNFQEDLRLSEAANDQRNMSFSYAGLASVFLEQGQYPEALDNYDKTLAIDKALNDRLGIAYTYMNRGNVLWRLGRYDEAASSLDQAFEISNMYKYKQVIAEIKTVKGQMALSQRRLTEAKSLSEQLLASEDAKYTELAMDAKYTLGLALALSGKAQEGRKLCDEAVSMASKVSDFWRPSNALLALAQVQLESGNADEALSAALQAQERFARAGQRESEWQSSVVAALACRRKGDEQAAQEHLTHARDVLSQLQQKWGDEVFNKYLSRPDIQSSRKQLG